MNCNEPSINTTQLACYDDDYTPTWHRIEEECALISFFCRLEDQTVVTMTTGQHGTLRSKLEPFSSFLVGWVQSNEIRDAIKFMACLLRRILSNQRCAVTSCFRYADARSLRFNRRRFFLFQRWLIRSVGCVDCVFFSVSVEWVIRPVSRCIRVRRLDRGVRQWTATDRSTRPLRVIA